MSTLKEKLDESTRLINRLHDAEMAAICAHAAATAADAKLWLAAHRMRTSDLVSKVYRDRAESLFQHLDKALGSYAKQKALKEE